MLTRKILSSTAALAMTASITLLAGCPTPGGTPVVSASADSTTTTTTTNTTNTTTVVTTPAPTAVQTVAPVATATMANTSTPVPNVSAPATQQSATGASNPVGVTGGTSDIKERATFNGKVYDPNGITVDGANVTAKSVDANVSWVGEAQVSTNGAYVFRNAPVGARVEINVTKDGWTTRTRTEVLKSNLQGDPTANVFDFGGLGTTGNDATSSFYAIQDEPEIISLKVNGRQATNSGGFPNNGNNGGIGGRNGRFGIANTAPTGAAQLRASIDGGGQPLSVSLTGVDNDRLDVELTFSEPVDRQSVQNNFKIISQNFDVRPNTTGFEIDENLGGLNFSWAADDRSVLVKTNKPILTTTTTPEARYLLKWSNPFKDKTEKQALKVGQGNISPTGHFRYNPGTNNDFNVFGVKIDDQSPRLLSISALDGGSANDVIRLTFNEPLELINQASLAFGLADPTDATNTASRQLFAYNTANNAGNNDSVGGDGASINQATVVGYTQGSTNQIDFRSVYMIARLPENISAQAQVNTQALATGQQINGNAVSTAPVRGGVIGQNVGNSSLLRFAKIDGNVVTMEFAPEAFNRNEKIIVSVGRNISTSYQDTSRSVSRTDVSVNNRSTGVNATPPYSNRLIDPAGNTLSTSNSTNSGNLQVNDSLRVATAS